MKISFAARCNPRVMSANVRLFCGGAIRNFVLTSSSRVIIMTLDKPPMQAPGGDAVKENVPRMNPFPFGKAALSILLLTVLSGLWLAVHPAPHQTATLVYWTFAKPHYEAYQKALPAFEAKYGVTVDLELVSNAALASRLQAALLANLDVPDLCEVEISQAGSLFRGPQKDIGFYRPHRPPPPDRPL